MFTKRVLIALLAAPIFAMVAHACSIPVFRYALERWELTPYEIVVFHKAPLEADAKALLGSLSMGPPSANVRVETYDLTKDVPKFYQKLFNKFGKDQPLPWVAVRMGDAEATAPLAWSGPLKAEALRPLISSPAREKLVDHLKRGETAVFMLLECGDRAKDDEARDLLAKELARLEKGIQLPAQSDEGPQLRTGLPLKVVFSILALKRDDPAEHAFIQTILSTEENLDRVKGPIVLPVFGRGRLLCSLFGEDLTAKQIGTVTRFLCSECSCQVKELNPGVDLLIPADWRELLEKAGPPATPRPDTPEPRSRKK
ncbi:MAG: hypothetical protein WCL32_12900 [Planctomycetota bacterium]